MRPTLFILMLGMLVFFSGCIQPESSPQVKEKAVSEEWKPDGLAGMNEYSNSMVLHGAKSQGYSGGDLEVSWKIDGQYLYMALNGSTNGWISVGFEPSEWMKDADILIGSVVDGRPVVLDEYSTGNYGPHVNDTELGGTDDILESGGMEKGGFTVVEFKRKLNTGDKFDKAFAPGQEISMIWALADSMDSQFKHNVAKGEAILDLQVYGQKPTNSSSLTPEDAGGILFIAEEEKIARDLYRSFFGINKMPIFQELAQSEQSHMDSVKPLIEKYDLVLPDNGIGKVNNQTLQQIHDDLLQKGQISTNESFISGATFEEMSIRDLQKMIAKTDKEDSRIVYQGLLAGSSKHLGSLVKEMKMRGVEYSPQLLSQEDYDKIIGV